MVTGSEPGQSPHCRLLQDFPYGPPARDPGILESPERLVPAWEICDDDPLNKHNKGLARALYSCTV